MSREDRQLLWCLAVVLLLLALWALTSCHTAAAIEQLPVGYWIATESLLLALLEDLWSAIKLLL